MAQKQTKTNAMRMLDKEKVAYTFHEYDHEDGAIDGVVYDGGAVKRRGGFLRRALG